MQSYQYIGGDDGVHLDLWKKLYKECEIPDYSSECFSCLEMITVNCFIEDSSQDRKVIGECCVSKFPRKGSVVEPSIKDNDKQKPLLSKENQTSPLTHFDGGKYKDFSFESVLNTDPGYMKWLSTKKAEEYGETKAYHNAVQFYLENEEKIKPFFKRGKYKGRTFESVRSENSQYFIWLKENKGNDSDYEEAIRWFGVFKESCFSSGSQTGKTFEEVFEDRPDYFEFLAKKEKELGEKYRPAIEWYKAKKGLPLTSSPTSSPTSADLKEKKIVFFFGKHKNKTLEEVWDDDPFYFRYLTQRGTSQKEESPFGLFSLKAMNFYQEKLGTKGGQSFESGKYKGNSYEEVLTEFPEYFEFLTNEYRGKNEDLLRALVWYKLRD
jgi:hypothetical protein